MGPFHLRCGNLRRLVAGLLFGYAITASVTGRGRSATPALFGLRNPPRPRAVTPSPLDVEGHDQHQEAVEKLNRLPGHDCRRSVFSDRSTIGTSGAWGAPMMEYTRNARDVYYRCMAKVRTNIEIEDVYVQAIMDRFSVRTKTEAVALALRHLAGQPMTREEALQMRGARAIDEVPADRSPQGAA